MIKKAVALLLCIGLVFSNMTIVSAEEMSSDSEIAVSEIEEEVILLLLIQEPVEKMPHGNWTKMENYLLVVQEVLILTERTKQPRFYGQNSP